MFPTSTVKGMAAAAIGAIPVVNGVPDDAHCRPDHHPDDVAVGWTGRSRCGSARRHDWYIFYIWKQR